VQKIKLIWDFRGPDAEQMAVHHTRHLDQFSNQQQLSESLTGTDRISEKYAVAWMVVCEDDMQSVRDKLRPHRGERWVASA